MIIEYPYDSIRSSLSQLVTRMTRHWRFIRRHLLGTRPSTNAKWCWVHQAAWRERGPDTSPPRLPSSHRAQLERPGRERSRRPPLALRLSRAPVRRRRRSGPPGARARRAKRGSRDSAVRARWARLPARRAATVRERLGRAGERRPRSGPGPGPGGAQWRGPRAGSTSPGRGAERRRSDADTGRPAGPAREGHVLQGACLGGGGQCRESNGWGRGVSAGSARTGLKTSDGGINSCRALRRN